MVYLYLVFAISLEVAATCALKATNEFTRLVPSVVVIVGYIASAYLLTIVLRSMPVGIAYAIWCGVGIVMVTLSGAIFYHQNLDLPAIIGMAAIIAGLLIIHLFSESVH